MSHIPASKMPHVTAHEDADDTDANSAAPAETLATMPAQSNDTVFSGNAPASDAGPATGTAPVTGPDATASDEGSAGTTRPEAQSSETSSSGSSLPIAAIAIGGLVAVGAIVAAVLPLLSGDKQAKKGGKKKKKRAEA